MERNYLPISDYGIIGNLKSAALISRHGSIDWCCFPYLDSPSVFAGLLDINRGGHFSVTLADKVDSAQEYLRDTNILRTILTNGRSALTITDFMPIDFELEGTANRVPEASIYRLLESDSDSTVFLDWSPRFDYARANLKIIRKHQGYLAVSGDNSLSLFSSDPRVFENAAIYDTEQPFIRVQFLIKAHTPVCLVSSWDNEVGTPAYDHAKRKLDETTKAWRSWVHKKHISRSWAGPHVEQVIRSELTLKLLSQSSSGAIAAAATTSLPEQIGGVRNWDYRISWIRDAALAAQALFALGHNRDARDFIQWAESAADKHKHEENALRVLYGLHESSDLEERELPNLEGYMRSAPVRIGNGAAGQVQHDIFGELLSAAYELVQRGELLRDDVRSFLPQVADEACENWRNPDYGIWEVRSGPYNFVFSKVMAWMALDRAIKLANRGHISGNRERWAKSMKEIHSEVLDKGFSSRKGYFKQAYERDEIDAANLLIPMIGFLPFDDPRIQSTIDMTQKILTEKDLVYRYRSDDGLAGQEGAFVFCSFWMTDVLALSGRMDEAYMFYEGILSRANHLGLFSEQIDPQSGRFLGNFPQAFSHIGQINSALYLAYKEGKELPFKGPIGTPEHEEET